MPREGRFHTDRARAESFGGVADQYDRFRPSYPVALVDDLVALHPADVLDVGCGTGKAARLLVERGLHVLGVEIDPQMAAVARRHRVDVEIASFETWQPRDRRFDLITCAQAWHWVDPAVAIPKAAGLLRPGGTLALFWNYDELDEPAQAAMDDVYRKYAPELLRSVVNGGNRQTDRPHVDDLEASGLFASVRTVTYRWEHLLSSAVGRSGRDAQRPPAWTRPPGCHRAVMGHGAGSTLGGKDRRALRDVFGLRADGTVSRMAVLGAWTC